MYYLNSLLSYTYMTSGDIRICFSKWWFLLCFIHDVVESITSFCIYVKFISLIRSSWFFYLKLKCTCFLKKDLTSNFYVGNIFEDLNLHLKKNEHKVSNNEENLMLNHKLNVTVIGIFVILRQILYVFLFFKGPCRWISTQHWSWSIHIHREDNGAQYWSQGSWSIYIHTK